MMSIRSRRPPGRERAELRRAVARRTRGAPSRSWGAAARANRPQRCACGLDGFDAGSIEVEGTRVLGNGDPRRCSGRSAWCSSRWSCSAPARDRQPAARAVARSTHGRNRIPRERLCDLELPDKERAFPAALSGGSASAWRSRAR
jgi:hypothetical protein